MSKNLEKEYSQYIDQQIPDLWNRIEAALPEKNVAKTVTETIDNNIDNKTDDKIVKFEKANKKAKKPNTKIISIFSGIAVAMIAGIVIVPTILNNSGLKSETAATSAREESISNKDNNKKSSKNKDKNMYLDAAMTNDAECATADEAVESDDYTAYDNDSDAACEEAASNDINSDYDSFTGAASQEAPSNQDEMSDSVKTNETAIPEISKQLPDNIVSSLASDTCFIIAVNEIDFTNDYLELSDGDSILEIPDGSISNARIRHKSNENGEEQYELVLYLEERFYEKLSSYLDNMPESVNSISICYKGNVISTITDVAGVDNTIIFRNIKAEGDIALLKELVRHINN